MIKIDKARCALVALAFGLTYATIGCGRTEEATDRSAAADETRVSVPAPAPDVPADAPTLAEAYPTLSNGALRLARLTRLPSGTLLHAEGLILTDRDLEDELAQAPAELREQLRKNAILIVEQMATRDLLVAQARRSTGNERLDEDRLLKQFFDEMTGKAVVTDAEITAFYEENQAMVGEIPFERVKPQIRQHILQEKQQRIVEDYVQGLGENIVIALSKDWVADQAPLMLDSPLDKARASGKPTFASFGADSCMPCQMMKPTREAIQEKYGAKLNVVYVHVDRDQMLASRYGVRGIPHIFFFDGEGKEIHGQTGLMTEDQIEEWLKKIGVTL